MTEQSNYPSSFPAQNQNQQPGLQASMDPQPITVSPEYKSGNKLSGKVAIITGGDSGIGRAVAVHFAKEGADVVISYLNEQQDADETKRMVENEGKKCLLIPGDIGNEEFCNQVVQGAINEYGKVDILVNNVAEQHLQKSISDITSQQLEKTFKTNVFSYFYMVKAALKHLTKGSCIINTTSITAYKGNTQLIDYSATKGAIVSFTRSLASSLVGQGIRVNGVAPGPIWTPLIPATFPSEQVATFGSNSPMKRAGQPAELAPAYVYLACEDSSYMTGQVLHINGGEIING